MALSVLHARHDERLGLEQLLVMALVLVLVPARLWVLCLMQHSRGALPLLSLAAQCVQFDERLAPVLQSL